MKYNKKKIKIDFIKKKLFDFSCCFLVVCFYLHKKLLSVFGGFSIISKLFVVSIKEMKLFFYSQKVEDFCVKKSEI